MINLPITRLLLVSVFSCFFLSANAATYYSKGNLSVNLTSSWSSTADGAGASPANFNGANLWIIQNTDTMTLTGSTNWSLSTATVRIENGGLFTNSTTGSIVDIGTFQIYGGGCYIHNSSTVALPGITKQFANSTNGGQGNSTVIIQSYNHTYAVSGVYGNLTINYTNTGLWNQNASLTAIEGDFIFNTGSSFAFRLGSVSSTLTIGGNFYLMSGIFQASNTTAGTYVINLAGDYLQSGGTFNPNTGASTLAFNFTGPNQVFNRSGGTLTNTLINWKVNTGASLALVTDLPVSSSRTLTIDGALSCGTSKITGAGSVSVSSAGTLKLGSLSASGALSDNVTATLNTLPAGAGIEYSGSGIQYENNQTFQNLSVSNMSGLTLGAGIVLNVKGSLVNNGLVTGSGKIVMNNSSLSQTLSGNGSVANLEIDNANGVAAAPGSHVNITDGLILTSGTLTTNDALVLKSTSITNTTRVHALGVTAALVGNVTVERYIPSRRAWRLLTTPLKGATNNSIYYNWQHNGGSENGTGLEVWGPGGTGESGNGLANTAAGSYSMRNYNATANIWSPVANTQTESLFGSTINKGLLAFVSGPYNSGHISSGAGATTLRATGELITGEQNYVFNDALALVGNPYACPINFDNVWNNAGNVNLARQFWVVDPNLNDVGGYVLVMHNGTDYSVTPSGAGTTFQDQYIQNGQAFFVTGAAAGQVTMKINEDDKETAGAQTAVFRTNGGNMETIRINLKAVPQNNSPALIDGALVNCHENYSNGIVTGEDGSKFLNFNESVSLIRNGCKFAIEGRPLLDQGDTVVIGLNGMRQRNYQLEMVPGNFNAPGLSATLYDNYLNTATPVNLTANTVYPFSVNAASASGNDSRFFIVFTNATPLAALFLSVKAEEKADGVHLAWKVSDDLNAIDYMVQKSGDGRTFSNLVTIAADEQKRYDYIDQQRDEVVQFYHICARLQNGRELRSRTVKVEKKRSEPFIAVYPNPVMGSQVQLKLTGLARLSYILRICNIKGQVILSEVINASGSSSIMSVDLSAFPAGTFFASLVDMKGNSVAEAMLVKQ